MNDIDVLHPRPACDKSAPPAREKSAAGKDMGRDKEKDKDNNRSRYQSQGGTGVRHQLLTAPDLPDYHCQRYPLAVTSGSASLTVIYLHKQLNVPLLRRFQRFGS